MLCRGDVSGAGVACSVAGMCRPSAEEFFCLGRSRDTGDAGAANPDGSRTPPPPGASHVAPVFVSCQFGPVTVTSRPEPRLTFRDVGLGCGPV